MASAAKGSTSATGGQSSGDEASHPRGVKRGPTLDEVRVHIIEFKLYYLDTL